MHLDVGTFAIIALAVTVGAGAQAAIGFAFGLIAAPVLIVAMQSGAAIQVLVVVHLVQSAMMVPGLWRQAPRRLIWLLGAGSVIGFPLGLLVFVSLDLPTLTLVVGLSLVLFSAMFALRETGYLHMKEVQPDAVPSWVLVATGVATGFLTSVLVMPGPPIMILNAWMRLSKDVSRALSLTFFAFCYVMVTLLHATLGGMPASAWQIAAMLAPFVVVGTLAGKALAPHLTEAWFRLAVLVVAAVSGGYAVWSAL